jgi:hypothetical protein
LSICYYRYYLAGQTAGFQDGLSYVFNPQSYARLTAASTTNMGSVLLAVMLSAEKAETSRDIPSRLFLVVFAKMLALLPFPVVLRDNTLVTLGP